MSWLEADLEVAAKWEDWQYTEEESKTIQKSGSGGGKPLVSPHPPLKKQNKRGKENKKNMLIKGQGTLDKFVRKVGKPTEDVPVMTDSSVGWGDSVEDDLCKSEDVLNKEYRLYRVSIFKKYFV